MPLGHSAQQRGGAGGPAGDMCEDLLLTTVPVSVVYYRESRTHGVASS
jgi:hypothetical protein